MRSSRSGPGVVSDSPCSIGVGETIGRDATRSPQFEQAVESHSAPDSFAHHLANDSTPASARHGDRGSDRRPVGPTRLARRWLRRLGRALEASPGRPCSTTGSGRDDSGRRPRWNRLAARPAADRRHRRFVPSRGPRHRRTDSGRRPLDRAAARGQLRACRRADRRGHPRTGAVALAGGAAARHDRGRSGRGGGRGGLCARPSPSTTSRHILTWSSSPTLPSCWQLGRARCVESLVADRSVALIVLVAADDGIPHVCTSLLDLCGPINARAGTPTPALASLPVQARYFGISERSALRLVQLPRRTCRSGGSAGQRQRSIPRDVTSLSLLPSHDPAAIAASWLAGGADPAPRTVIGVAADGVVDIDLDRDGPHALMAGTTGAGKSELLRTLVVGLAVTSSPDHLTFVLIDYKGGSTFDACARLPHVVGVVTDLDDHLANRALRCLHAELRRREQTAARALVRPTSPPTDARAPEGSCLASSWSSTSSPRWCRSSPTSCTRSSASPSAAAAWASHLILATQRPSGVISDDIRGEHQPAVGASTARHAPMRSTSSVTVRRRRFLAGSPAVR